MSIIKQDYGSLGNDVQTQMLIAPVLPTMVSDRAYAVGEQFIVDNVLYKITQAVSGANVPLVVGTNCEVSDSITQQINSADVQHEFTPTMASGYTNISSGFGPRESMEANGYTTGSFHYGTDFNASCGN